MRRSVARGTRAAHVPDVIAPIHDFRHPHPAPGRPYNGAVSTDTGRSIGVGDSVRGGRWLHLAAVATWLVCGIAPAIQILQGRVTGWPATVFFASLLAYGAALLTLLYLPDGRGRVRVFLPVLLVIVESITALTVIYISGTYLGGTGATAALMVIVAAQLPYVVTRVWVWAGVAAQTVALTAMFWPRVDFDELISVALAIGGFQLFAAASSLLARSEAAARGDLADAHAALQAAQARLAENSRSEERLRISRDLHDTLGHHLTALSLQLDVASRVSTGKAADHVAQAHAITRLLLADVRDVVSTLRDPGPTDVAKAIRALSSAPASLAIHLDVPASLEIGDASRAQAVVRSVQEIITNAARHAQARNLWIRLAVRDDGVTLHARDDGRGATALAPGHGLTGMRERFEAAGGSIDFDTRAAGGFEVRAFLPVAPAAP